MDDVNVLNDGKLIKMDGTSLVTPLSNVTPQVWMGGSPRGTIDSTGIGSGTVKNSEKPLRKTYISTGKIKLYIYIYMNIHVYI